MNEKLTKKEAIRNSFLVWISTIMFFGIVMFIISGKFFWNMFWYIALGFFVFVGIIGYLSYIFWNRNPNKLRKLRSHKGKRNMSALTIVFGGYLILSGLFQFFSNPFGQVVLRFVLIKIFFGLFTILWGIYYLRRFKRSG